ncbi:Hypothetical predicted protein [Mytilus galloprovincialis]|uniref:Uncharacterized protein n=1 Tax=Mytilus galloprovincialis TaxID=29158 RepID=A0A8B6H1I5_MYTGA|nr:Hypothetical predicted protein [Mytilus galloprovincialis]
MKFENNFNYRQPRYHRFSEYAGICRNIGETRLKHLTITTGKLTDTVYNVGRLVAIAIHITSGHKVVVGGSRGREVVLEQGGDIANVYTGHPDINNDHPFKPWDIVATLKDNVVVKSQNDPVLHILNNQGYPTTYYNTNNIGIFHQYSLAFNTSGQLCIGCSRAKGRTTNEAKLYEVNISGF